MHLLNAYVYEANSIHIVIHDRPLFNLFIPHGFHTRKKIRTYENSSNCKIKMRLNKINL